ncbi:hypothetical protein LCGC14_1629360 [marine sediment metagenome]|uniref:Uncharacterized protein n=1 Tax=marine sediment metagenome TaxID=412755 RepID=A0A0F9L2W4_9ZZZZ
MTKDEILEQLESIGIIMHIENEYLLTEKYKEIMRNASTPVIRIPTKKDPVLDYEELLNPETSGSDWVTEILDTAGRTRADALMNACKIPVKADKGYRLRGLDKQAINIIGNIVESNDISPLIFVEAIQLYYKYTEMPKGFKNLLLDGDALDIYNEHLEGKLLPGLKPKDNTTQKWN